MHAAINLPLGVDPDSYDGEDGDGDERMAEAGGAAPPRDALLRGALSA